jgi:hypothetical protein
MHDDSAYQQQALLDNDGEVCRDDLEKDVQDGKVVTVKLQLPDGSIVDGTVYGTGLFAKITWLDKTLGWMKPIEAGWETVARCLNNNRPVIY